MIIMLAIKSFIMHVVYKVPLYMCLIAKSFTHIGETHMNNYVPKRVDGSLIERITNDPEASGEKQIMSAEAVSKKAGRLAWEFISGDVQSKPNMRYISSAENTITLPDPNGTYINTDLKEMPVTVGDIIVLDQLDSRGGVVTHDDEYAEIFDTGAVANGGRRIIFEVFRNATNDANEWKQVLTGTDSAGRSIAVAYSSGDSINIGLADGTNEGLTYLAANVHIGSRYISDITPGTEQALLMQIPNNLPVPTNAEFAILRSRIEAVDYSKVDDGSDANNNTALRIDPREYPIADESLILGQFTDIDRILQSTLTVPIHADKTFIYKVATESNISTSARFKITTWIDGWYIKEPKLNPLRTDSVRLVGGTIYPQSTTRKLELVENWNDCQIDINLTHVTGLMPPRRATHVIATIHSYSTTTGFDHAKQIYGSAYTGQPINSDIHNLVSQLAVVDERGKVVDDDSRMCYIPINMEDDFHFSLRIMSQDGNEASSDQPENIEFFVHGYLVHENDVAVNNANPLVGMPLTGVSEGGSNWSFPGLMEPPATTCAFRNGKFVFATRTNWINNTLAIEGSKPSDEVQLMVFVEAQTTGDLDLGDVQVSDLALNTQVVHKTGSESIDGMKTFLVIPKIPTEPSTDDDAASKAYVDSRVIDSAAYHYVGTFGTDEDVPPTAGELDTYTCDIAADETYFSARTNFTCRRGDMIVRMNGGWILISKPSVSGVNGKTGEISLTLSDMENVDNITTAAEGEYLQVYLVDDDGTSKPHVRTVPSSAIFNEEEYVKTTGNGSISGVKQFTDIIKCGVSPTVNEDIPNKLYVDSAVQGVKSAAVLLSGNQTIGGTKTFNVPPKSATVPLANDDVVNKSYVDSEVQNTYSSITDVSGDVNEIVTLQKIYVHNSIRCIETTTKISIPSMADMGWAIGDTILVYNEAGSNIVASGEAGVSIVQDENLLPNGKAGVFTMTSDDSWFIGGGFI